MYVFEKRRMFHSQMHYPFFAIFLQGSNHRTAFFINVEVKTSIQGIILLKKCSSPLTTTRKSMK